MRYFDNLYFDGSGEHSGERSRLLHRLLSNALSNLSGLQQGVEDEDGKIEQEIWDAAHDIATALTGKKKIPSLIHPLSKNEKLQSNIRIGEYPEGKTMFSEIRKELKEKYRFESVYHLEKCFEIEGGDKDGCVFFKMFEWKKRSSIDLYLPRDEKIKARLKYYLAEQQTFNDDPYTEDELRVMQ